MLSRPVGKRRMLTITIPEELARWLKQRARRDGARSVSSLVRDLLARAREADDKEQEHATNATR